MDRVAPKIAQEIAMFFQHERPHARTCKQEGRDHSGWTTANDNNRKGITVCHED